METLEQITSRESLGFPSFGNLGKMYMPSRAKYEIKAPSYSIKDGMLCIDPFGTVRDGFGNIIVHGIGQEHMDITRTGVYDRTRFDGDQDEDGNCHLNYETYAHNGETGRDKVFGNTHINIGLLRDICNKYGDK